MVWCIALLTLYTALDYLVRYRIAIEKIMLASKAVQLLSNALVLIATCGLVRFKVVGPGTIASVAATCVGYYVFPFFSFINPWVGLVLGLLFLGGWLCATQAAHVLHAEDPGIVVIDEFLAMLLVLYWLPFHSIWWYAAACGLFRLFDIFKIFPVNVVERRIKGGLGIMLDDLMAAVCTVVILFVLSAFSIFWLLHQLVSS
jgi:phosphatidylglycerophosphatase A